MKLGFTSNNQELKQKMMAVFSELTEKIGTGIVEFTTERFDQASWIDTSRVRWKDRAKDTFYRKGKKGNDLAKKGRGLLVQTGNLRNSFRITNKTAKSVTVGTSIEYAEAHNEGMNNVAVSVPGYTRTNSKKTSQSYTSKAGNERTRTVKTFKSTSEVKAHTKKMNLPQRRFLGNSAFLNKKLLRLIINELNSI